MLARVASNLFWMGRYIERAEHTARFLSVNYFSSLDAPNSLSQSRQFVLTSVCNFVDEDIDDCGKLSEEDILFNVGLNQEKDYSIIKCLQLARENANSSRDLISTEFYESINKFYHLVNNYPKDKYVKSGLYDFTTNVTEHTAILRGKIRGTLLHDEIYALIMLGMNIERATQITSIIKTKFNDAEKAVGGYSNPVRNSFEWTTLLKCTESYDMMKRYYKKTPNQINTLEFLVLNKDCPRSVMNSLNQLYKHIGQIDSSKFGQSHSAAFLIGKMRSEYNFKTISEIQENIKDFVYNTNNRLMEISLQLEKEYFFY
ncbi:Uncharacterized conserved protein, Alpha-E superfamily [Flavobacteriaceae bacterium MAR_2010_188]|nr:Uncharacterized conserved protein, Alpha-E superfamily [Flavobacteriaceae bacterium MAR_2010_188]